MYNKRLSTLNVFSKVENTLSKKKTIYKLFYNNHIIVYLSHNTGLIINNYRYLKLKTIPSHLIFFGVDRD